MSERSRKLIDDLKERLSYSLDNAFDDNMVTGFSICENSNGDILVNIDRAEKESDLRLKCPYASMTPRASIIISPKKKF